MDKEFYLMPSFLTLVVRNLSNSTNWYQKTLGFKLVYSIPGANAKPMLTHLRWTKYADLLLVEENPQQPLAHNKFGVGVMLRFAVVEGTVDEIAEKARSCGANIIVQPVTRSWNIREFMILDPDGYQIQFTQQIDLQMQRHLIVENVHKNSDYN
jgi:uncharacterized glyoxalase superfamily protein PhnB